MPTQLVIAKGCLAAEPPENACLVIRDALDFIAEVSVEAVSIFFDESTSCPGIVGFVSHGPPPIDAAVSQVAVWTESMTPIFEPVAGLHGPQAYDVTIAAQLWLEGFPVGEVDGDRFFPPPQDDINSASRMAMAMGETWYRTLGGLVRQNTGRCAGWKLAELLPIEPAGGMIGWETGLSFRA